jgi:drug/metabolite transporter (DMT)-like permease
LSVGLKGNLLAVGGAASWAAYSVAIAPLMRRYSPFRISAFVLIAGSVPLAASAAPQLVDQDYSLDPLIWAAFVFALLGPLVLTNVLWFTAIDRVGPSRAALFANLTPFFGAAFALLLLSERMTGLQLAGGAAIVGGIWLARARTPPEPPAD